MMAGITRTTGRKEIVRACVECIAFQITDVVNSMCADRASDEGGAGTAVKELRVDGGPTCNQYLMQFQSDILDENVLVPEAEELSGIGAAYAAGIGAGLYGKEIFGGMRRKVYIPRMSEKLRNKKYGGWKQAVSKVLVGSEMSQPLQD